MTGMNKIDQLPDDPQLLKRLLKERDAKIAYLEEQFYLAQQKRFGQSSEGHPGQGELFNEAEAIAESVEAEPETQDIRYTRKKPTRQALPKDLPRERIVHDIEDKTCRCCGHDLHQMGEDITEKLDFVPAKVKVIEHVRPKYSCRHCEKQETEVAIQQASMPAMPIKKGIATSSLLSQLIVSKYQYGLPLYRQESLFKQYGIALSRQTMSDWVLKCGQLFKPIVAHWQRVLRQQPVVHADETTVNVVSDDNVKSYMWVYCSGADSPTANRAIPNIVLFDYQPNRSARCCVEYLRGYQGYLHVDGYQAYEKTEATLVGCWAHARRKFKEAEVAQGKKAPSGKATWALNHIQKLYRLETRLKGNTPDEKYRVRQTEALPLLDQYKQWLDKSALHVPPKSKLGEAITYSLNQWEKLMRYTLDGRLQIDNNRAERAIKPFVIGRKAWLFSQTANGATASACLYSVIETAKANGLTPFDYVRRCLDELAKPEPDLDSLSPWMDKPMPKDS